ncbi:MAG: hypothetical protein BECKG1743D_GA0114223_111231 [Candidatus Kentron sp. G]|nr:MAG: hypothetical protein BECKG1743D_GA0114223_111231 [Candidatus Kentron sp. G]VFN07846.1 MAG: hypothetical protein BECKG1743E_GA0114224_113121 [Candidatus Kentron sp. G]
MIHTIEATIDESGHVCLGGSISIKGIRRALVTVIEKPPGGRLETLSPSERNPPVSRTGPVQKETGSHLPTFNDHLLSMPKDDGDFERVDIAPRATE